MQGWTPDFVSRLTTDTVQLGLIDQIVPVAGTEALRLARALAREEGIFCGISAGATLAGALSIAEHAEPGANILCMLPDTGERYLSTPLFDDIAVEMSEEETSISQTTPGFRFDVQPEASAESQTSSVMVTLPPAAQAYVETVVTSEFEPVVMFSLEWCEFCWSVRKLFAEIGVEYRSIDLDSVEYQRDNWGGDIKVVLEEITQAPTIPQIFVAGQHMGGCTETFDAFKDGRLQALFSANGISYNQEISMDPYRLLPAWLHPR